MIGDRVRITSSGAFLNESNEEIVPVYKPRIDPTDHSRMLYMNDGTVIVECVGGIKGGETGAITGDPIRVSRTQLKGYQHQVPGLGLKDEVLLFPVMLEHYQQTAWVYGDHLVTVAGDRV